MAPIGSVLSELLARTNFARLRSDAALLEAWQQVLGNGPEAAHSRPVSIKGGKLEVIVANSTLLQELTFRSDELLTALKGQLPQLGLRGLRFRVGKLEPPVAPGTSAASTNTTRPKR